MGSNDKSFMEPDHGNASEQEHMAIGRRGAAADGKRI